MNDDKPRGGRPFRWGLRPSADATPEEPTEDRVAVSPARRVTRGATDTPDALHLGHLFATPTPYVDVSTEAFLFRPQSALSAGVEPADTEPADVIPESTQPGAYEDVATQALPFAQPAPPRPAAQPQPLVEPPAAAHHGPPAIDSALDGVVEVSGAQPVVLPAPTGEGPPTSALDALFNDREFQMYTDESPVAVFIPRASDHDFSPAAGTAAPVVAEAAAPARHLRAVAPPRPPRGPGVPLSRHQRALVWVAGALVAVLVLVGLFYVGTRFSDTEPVAVREPAPSPAAESASPDVPAEPDAPDAPVLATIGPAAPGVHAWNQLLGTECLQPFASAWEEQYTVVDCAEPHAAQLVYRGRFEESALDPYPGVDGLQSRMNLLCANPTNVDYGAASLYSDIQVSASFAGTADAWAEGNRDYYCFVHRASGQPFAASISTPPQARVVIPVAAAPEP
jgi:hypothetical protein